MQKQLTVDDVSFLYEQHFEKLYRFFYYKVLQQTEAEDLTSDTFLAFAKAVQDKKHIEDPIKFLYGVARNTFTVHLQRKYRENSTSLEGGNFEDFIAATNEQASQCDTVEELLQKYLSQIPEKQREVLELRFLQKLSPTEIAQHLNKDSNYVRTTQKRGLQTLKQIIATNNV